MCGLRVLGQEVEDYISRITDPELVAALLLDPRADNACARTAGRRLLELRGVQAVRALLADRRKTHPDDFARPEPATLLQLVGGPYARLKVASVLKAQVGAGAAERALDGLKADLAGGRSWAEAYGRAADRLPDVVRSKSEGGGSRTFVTFVYDGLVAPTGFDLLDRRVATGLDPAHLRQLFTAKGGTHLWETVDAFWLYHAESFDE